MRILRLPPAVIDDDDYPLAYHALKRSGIDQQDLAERLGVSDTMVSLVLSGRKKAPQRFKDTTVAMLGGHWTEDELFDV